MHSTSAGPHTPAGLRMPPLPSATDDPAGVLVAVDLDGTILEEGSLIRPETVAAIGAARQRGVRFTTASGRPLEFQLDVLGRFGLDGGAFSALICEERDLHLYRGGSGAAAFEPVASWNEPTRARWDGLAAEAFGWVEWLLSRAAERGWAARLHHTWSDTLRSGLGVVAFGAEEHAIEFAEVLRARLRAESSGLACNRNRHLVQVHDALVDKASSLTALSGVLGVEPGHVLAIGDSDNDRSMVDGHCGFRSATVANATPGVKDAVRRAGGTVADAPAGAGVAALLNDLVRAR